MAPTNQYLIYGSESTTLICSYADSNITPDPVATVERDDELVSGNTITQANLDDEGEYECDIFLPGHQASIGVLFTVRVIGELILSLRLSLSLSLPCFLN